MNLLVFALLAGGTLHTGEDERVYSGPQVGERILGFKVVGVHGEIAGKELDVVELAEGKPVLLLFMHQVTRPAAALMRTITSYAHSRKQDNLQAFVVWLSADRPETEEFLKRAQRSLNIKVPVGISLDGAEGPGAYGLNRKVTMTVLVANENKVTANFALTQPNVTDATGITQEIVKLIGGEPPSAAQLEALAFPGRAERMRREKGANNPGDPMLGRLLRAMVREDAEPNDVEKTAAEIEKYVGDDKVKKVQLGTLAQRILARGLGTEAATKRLKIWGEKYSGERGKAKSPLKKGTGPFVPCRFLLLFFSGPEVLSPFSTGC